MSVHLARTRDWLLWVLSLPTLACYQPPASATLFAGSDTDAATDGDSPPRGTSSEPDPTAGDGMTSSPISPEATAGSTSSDSDTWDPPPGSETAGTGAGDPDCGERGIWGTAIWDDACWQ